MADEEESLFPRLPREPDIGGLCEQLAREHRQHEALAAKLNDLVELLPAPDRTQTALEVARELDAAYRRHTALEDERLLPLLDRLDERVRADIGREMQRRRGGGGGGGRRR
jgi:hemerythrin-like domain-containing protein